MQASSSGGGGDAERSDQGSVSPLLPPLPPHPTSSRNAMNAACTHTTTHSSSSGSRSSSRSSSYSSRRRRRAALLTSLVLVVGLVCSDYMAETHKVDVIFNLVAPSLSSSITRPGQPLPFPVQAFWHLGDTGLSSFDLVAHEQYERLQRSGLLNLTHVSATYIGPDPSDMPRFNHPRIAMEFDGPASLNEFPTLRKLQTYCETTPTGRVLYFHTKGAGYPVEHDQFNRSQEWRYLMEHFILDLHDTLLRNELGNRSPYVTVGVQYWSHKPRELPGIPPHYRGNFWMAKCSFINELTRIDAMDLSDRYDAEFWLSTGKDFDARHRDCWSMQKEEECDPPGFDLYQCAVKRSAYEAFHECRRQVAPPSSLEWRRKFTSLWEKVTESVKQAFPALF